MKKLVILQVNLLNRIAWVSKKIYNFIAKVIKFRFAKQW